MRIGIMTGAGSDQDTSLDGMIQFAQRCESLGFNSLWMAQIFSYDAITVLSLIGHETDTIELGTAVVPSFPRHPTALAQQVLTAHAACQGRFTLGLGLSHQWVIETMLGLDYQKPASHMREYLEVLIPLLNSEAVDFQGEQFKVQFGLDMPANPGSDASKPGLLLAALGPRMLKIAGTMSDGTSTWMAGIQTLESHIVPSITAAAAEVDNNSPRIVAGIPIALCSDANAARTKLNESLEVYGNLPSYRTLLDRENATAPGDIALLGDETALRQQIQRLRNIGVTDFNAAIMGVEDGCYERTLEFLATELNHDE